MLPVVLVAAAAACYLRSVPARGNDIAFDLTLAAAGVALGALCAPSTHLRPGSDGVAPPRAGWMAAGLWIVSIGARMGFAFWTDYGGGPAIAVPGCAQHHRRQPRVAALGSYQRFPPSWATGGFAHQVTGAAITDGRIVMAIAMLITCTVGLSVLARKLPAGAAPDRATEQA